MLLESAIIDIVITETLISKYHEQLDTLAQSETPAVEQAAQLVWKALQGGGAIWLAEIGHSLQKDFLSRAGGLAALRHFAWNLTLDQSMSEAFASRVSGKNEARSLAATKLAVETGNMRAGDVLVLGSVSGKNSMPVELALSARALGAKVIAFTSMTYTRDVTSIHPSGKRLFECADVVLDLHTPYGDCAMSIAGYDHLLVPFSGFSAIVLGWMLWARVMELGGETSEPPITFMSINRDGGKEAYEAAMKTFNARGY